MKRVLVLGSGGSGKSTLASQVGARLNVPVLHLDESIGRGGGPQIDPERWGDYIRDLVAAESWVLDGNNFPTMAIRLARADTAVFLDLPRLVCISRILRRWWGNRHRSLAATHRATGPGRASSLRAELGARLRFLWWIWTYRGGPRRRLLALIQREGQDVRFVRLRSPAEVRRWIESIGTPG